MGSCILWIKRYRRFLTENYHDRCAMLVILGSCVHCFVHLLYILLYINGVGQSGFVCTPGWPDTVGMIFSRFCDWQKPLSTSQVLTSGYGRHFHQFYTKFLYFPIFFNSSHSKVDALLKKNCSLWSHLVMVTSIHGNWIFWALPE